MDTQLFTSLESYLKNAELVGSVILVGALVYSVWRTGSLHLVRRRLWAILYGKDEISDETIRTFVSGKSSLMAFRFNAGVHARTLEQARDMAKWSSENNEDVRAISIAGKYFDRDGLELKELPKLEPRIVALSAAVFVLTVVFVFGWPALSSRGYYSVNATGLWFSASDTDIREAGRSFIQKSFPWVRFSSELPVLTLAMCMDKKIPAGTFGGTQSDTLCQFLQTPGRSRLLAVDISSQKGAAAGLMSCFVFWLGIALIGMLRLDATWKMKSRLDARERQTSFDF